MNTATASSLAVLLAQAKHAFNQGDLQSAANICQQILQQDESCAPAYALMAEVWAQIQHFDNAVKFSGFALKFDGDNVHHLLRNAQFLIIIGQFDEAKQRLSRALMLDPKNYKVHLLMGDAHFNLRLSDEAMQCYGKAQLYSNQLPEIEEHIAFCYMTQDKLTEADAALGRLTVGLPNYYRGWVLRGDLKLRLKDIEAADACYDAALEANLASYEAWLGKGLVAIERNDKINAPIYLDKSLDANPNFYRTYFTLADYLYKHQLFEESVKFYQRTVELNPSFVEARRKLAINLFNLRRREESLVQIDQVLQMEPGNETITFLRSILMGETVEQSPREHIANLFDVYADTFEDHLTQTLQYKTPTALIQALERVLRQCGDARHHFSLLDIGCGTGLFAEAAISLTNYRAGVDLSSRMIEVAAKKGIYQDVAVEDGVEYLQRSLRSFDLIAAADVLVYMGNLEPLFVATASKIASGGYFVFSVENGDDAPPYILRISGRFAHAAQYIASLAQKYGFEQLLCEAQVIRNEQHVPVEGYIFVLRHH